MQPMVSGTEIALGLVRDPSMGPLVMVASGGVATDVWDDRVFLVPPVSPAEAARAIGSLRISRLLAGFRGAPAGDLAGLTGLVTALGRLAVDVPEVAELDLNPVMVSADGCAVVDAKVRLATPVGPDSRRTPAAAPGGLTGPDVVPRTVPHRRALVLRSPVEHAAGPARPAARQLRGHGASARRTPTARPEVQ